MASPSDGALIVQSDGSVLLAVHAPRAQAAREALAPFAELVKSPEHVHTYRLTSVAVAPKWCLTAWPRNGES